MKTKNKTTVHTRNSINRSPKQRGLPRVQPVWIIRGFLLITLLFACFALSHSAQGVVPPPDGGYPGGNTAEGQGALFSLTGGVHNTALGFQALFNNTTGNTNLASGSLALRNNTRGLRNTAVGFSALSSNTTGFGNTATGCLALSSNTTSNDNTADGFNALLNNTGFRNTAVGQAALFQNVGGDDNTAVGRGALSSNTDGNANTAVGRDALDHNTTGFSNTALGASAGANISTASNVICIGATGEDLSNTMWIGNVFGVITQSGTTAPVIVSSTGQLGTAASSERFKKDIATMDRASEDILSLRPVTFHYKSDVKATPQFGLIAEEVAKVNPALVLPDKEGKPYTVRYDAVNAMLLNEFLKEQRRVEEQDRKMQKQEATIGELKSTIAQQQKQIERLTSGLEKVSDKVDMSRHAPQIVDNRQ